MRGLQWGKDDRECQPTSDRNSQPSIAYGTLRERIPLPVRERLLSLLYPRCSYQRT
ncbi:hypothetical protein [Chamaesiphon polymorphus]|uniref:hypothetical protein n=1 Tax=Chamaesiphon polymorphus TaxID=2107691 RepID=UPI0015E749F6|nr:hypothetical protein [Chamaesiphon polymorphus]